jgi:putative methanogen marker protein 4
MITIAIGVGENKDILEACDIFKKEKQDVNLKLIENEELLAKSILDKNINATIRGSLTASNVLKQLKERYPKISRATYINGQGHEFLISSVGIDEGNTTEEKLKIAIHCIDFLKKLNKTPKIATLSYARPGDYGRSEEINKSLDDTEKLTKLIEKHTNQKIEDKCVLIDQAIKNKCNILIAPNGIVGNTIFRTLVLLNSWPSFGAITLGIDEIYIDTSRDQNVEGYLRSLKLAYKLAKL